MTKDFNVELPVICDVKYSITDFGAVPGGRQSNTAAFRRAVETAWNQGGGHVIVPPGLWLTGPVELRSGIDLHIEKGAVLLFDKNPEEYPLRVTEYEGVRRVRALSPIHAADADNISITGRGIIDGNGHLWRMAKEFKFTSRQWKKMTAASPDTVYPTEEGQMWFPTRSAYEGFLAGEPDLQAVSEEEALKAAAPYYDFYRPVMVSLIRCSRVLIEGVALENSPAWNIHPIYCRDLTIRDAMIRNAAFAQNGDGLDLESCSRVEIDNVQFDVGDDAICMKSGKNAEARLIPIPTENVYIHDCTVFHGHGGFSVGSEMSRGIRNILVERCVFIGTDVGIRFKSTLGRGGVVENITIRDITMLRIPGEAIILTMGYVLFHAKQEHHDGNYIPGETRITPEDIPEFKDIHISRVVCQGAGCGLRIEGLSQMPIHDMVLEDISLTAKDGYAVAEAENIRLKHVEFIEEATGKNIVFEDKILRSGDRCDFN